MKAFLNSSETSAEQLLASAREMERNGMTFVRFCDIDRFLLICNVIGVVCFGGAFASDMSGQYFYI